MLYGSEQQPLIVSRRWVAINAGRGHRFTPHVLRCVRRLRADAAISSDPNKRDSGGDVPGCHHASVTLPAVSWRAEGGTHLLLTLVV